MKLQTWVFQQPARFLTRDGAGDGRNWYSYCANRPLVAADPNGKFVVLILIAAFVIVGALATEEAGGSGGEGIYPSNPGPDPRMPLIAGAIQTAAGDPLGGLFNATSSDSSGSTTLGSIHDHHILPKWVQKQLQPDQIPPGAENETFPVPGEIHTGAGGFHSGSGYSSPGGHYNNLWNDEIESSGGYQSVNVEQVRNLMDIIKGYFNFPPPE